VSTNDRAPRGNRSDPDPIVLRVELAPGRELRGSIRRHDDTSSMPFHGWIDFMAALSLLRDAADVPNREWIESADPATPSPLQIRHASESG